MSEIATTSATRVRRLQDAKPGSFIFTFRLASTENFKLLPLAAAWHVRQEQLAPAAIYNLDPVLTEEFRKSRKLTRPCHQVVALRL